MKRISLLLTGLAALYFIFFSGVPAVYNRIVPAKNAVPFPSNSAISVTIDFGNKKETASVQAATAYQALLEIAKKQQIPLKTKQYDFGVFVQAIGDKENTKDMAWIYFVNGKAGTVAADKQPVTSGDTVEWHYMKPSTE